MPTPAFPLGTLTGSIEGDDLLMRQEALRQQQQRELQAQTKALGQQAQQAQTDYTQAAGAPPPDLSALAFLSSLGGGISEVLGNRGASERAQQNVAQTRSSQLQARAQNLQALRDVALRRAEEAQQAGDLETTEKYRRQYETLAKQGELINSNAKRAQDLEDREFQAEQSRLERVSRERIVNTRTTSSSGGEGVDADAIAEGIMRGDLPPVGVNLGRGGTWAKIVTKLSKSGYKLGKAQQEWQAVQRHIATLNGRQQLQIRTSATTVTDALDNLDALNDRLSQLVPRSQATLLNRGINTAAREWGAAGPEAQDIATQLRAQTADIIPELANIYMAGGVPTDRALKLARETINENMSPNALKAQTRLARTNLGYRINAIKNSLPITGQGGEVLPQGVAQEPQTTGNLVRMIDKHGKVRVIDASEVPDAISKGGWKRAPAK